MRTFGRRERREALEGQLLALAARHYEVAVVDGRVTRRVWRAGEVASSFRWLAVSNHRGAHILLRPAGTEFVLLVDIAVAAVVKMGRDGLVPAAIVETSSGSYEAWLRFPEPLAREVATAVAEVLAQRYGADPVSADFRHLGRAVGFSNRRREYRGEGGRYPWVRLAEATGEVTPGAGELVVEGRGHMLAKEERRREVADLVQAARAVGRTGTRQAARVFLQEVAARAGQANGGKADEDRVDAEAARRMAAAGYSEGWVMAAVMSAPSVRRRKAGCVAQYAAETVGWAFAAGNGEQG